MKKDVRCSFLIDFKLFFSFWFSVEVKQSFDRRETVNNNNNNNNSKKKVRRKNKMKDDTMSMLTWSMLQNKTCKFYTFMEDLFIQCLLKMINKYSVYITRADSCRARVLSFLIRYFSNYYTLLRSDLAARAAPLDPRLHYHRLYYNKLNWITTT